ncbi:hypothetical protein M5689_000745 [Euphorbia peplus]|nr:hypothetical protein M5689_000745 [Euphorbia peplus]
MGLADELENHSEESVNGEQLEGDDEADVAVVPDLNLPDELMAEDQVVPEYNVELGAKVDEEKGVRREDIAGPSNPTVGGSSKGN